MSLYVFASASDTVCESGECLWVLDNSNYTPRYIVEELNVDILNHFAGGFCLGLKGSASAFKYFLSGFVFFLLFFWRGIPI